MPPKFGTSGLRGLVTELTPDLVADYTRAFLAACETGTGLYVGRDLRASSPRIAGDVIAAARAEGITVEMLIRREVHDLINPESGFRAMEKVGRVGLIDHEFSVEDGTMTRTLKLKRNVIHDKYADLIDDIYEKVYDSIYHKPIDSLYIKEDAPKEE